VDFSTLVAEKHEGFLFSVAYYAGQQTETPMALWMVWMIAAGVMVILEMFSGTFYLLMIAIGLVSGAVVAYAGGLLEIQIIVAAVLGILATVMLRQSRIGNPGRVSPTRDPNVNLDIGQSIIIQEWNMPLQGNGVATARVMYRGALWDVDMAHPGQPMAGQFIIREMQGSRLIVSESI
jgi:membrane protein implicated in regulation of membrane protease activity